MTDTNTPFGRAMTLAAVSGLRAALGPAFLETSRGNPKGRNWVLGSIGEMALAKVGVLPRGYHPLMLIPHSLSGAWVARESMRKDGVDDDPSVPIAGAVVAAGVASVAPIARIALTRGLGVSGTLLGLAEDYLAPQTGRRGHRNVVRPDRRSRATPSRTSATRSRQTPKSPNFRAATPPERWNPTTTRSILKRTTPRF